MRRRRRSPGVLVVVLGVLAALVLLASLTVTGARVLSPPGLTWVRLVSLSPYATLGYLLALVLLLLGRVGAAGRSPVALRGLVVLAVLGTVLHAAWLAGPYVDARGTAGSGRDRLQVLTVNLRLGGADIAQVVDLARADRVDVLVLEEVSSAALRGLERAGVRRLLAHRAGSADPGSRGTVVYSRATLREVHRIGPAVTGCYAMELALPTGAVQLVAAHPRAPIVSYADWRADQRRLRRAAAAIPGPVLVVGDLNATLDHPELRGMLGDGFVDAASSRVQWQPTWPSSGYESLLGVPVPPLFAIDHVLARGGPRALDTRTLRVTRTDHRGLLVTLAV